MLLAPLQPLPIENTSMVRPTYQSFRLLHRLEWLLVATAMVMEVSLPFQFSWSSLFRVLTIAIFGAMGFSLPTDKVGAKLLYTALEFGLLLLPLLQGGLSTRSVFLLCLVLVMRSCLIFGRSSQFVALCLSLLCYGTLILSRPIVPEKLKTVVWDWRLSSVLLFSLTMVFALMLINALLAERQSRSRLEIALEELETTHAQLRQYALRVEDQATLQERNRIAREIHDGLGHTLTAQTIQINNALLFWQSDNDKALTFLKQTKQLAAEALLEIRRSVSVLRSNPLQGQPLEAAIEALLTNFQLTTGIEPACKIDLPYFLPPEVNTTVYRLVQESLTNIYKHAHATTVTVQIQQHIGALQLSIEDNGNGFNPTQNTTGFGLQGMRERATALGGQLHLASQSGEGCRVSVALPVSSWLH